MFTSHPPDIIHIISVPGHEMLTNQILLFNFETVVATPWLQYVRLYNTGVVLGLQIKHAVNYNIC